MSSIRFLILLFFFVGLPVNVGVPMAQAQSCWAGDLFYSASDYAALRTEADRVRYVRSEVASIWGDVTPRVANFANLYGALDYSSALARPDAVAIERAMTLSAAQRAEVLQGRPYNAGRVNRALSAMQEGTDYASRLGNALGMAGQAIDAVNVFYFAYTAHDTGSRMDKLRALQAAMSLGRARLASRWGSSMGPMMAMTGLLEYSVGTFAETAWDRYESYWWQGYRNFNNAELGLDAEGWLALYEAEGHAGIHARLGYFWEHEDGVDALAAVYRENQSSPTLTIARSGYAVAEYQQAFAARYMIEVVEPLILEALRTRADRALDDAMNAFMRDCEAALAEADAIDIAYTLIEAAPAGFQIAACPMPRAFERGISGAIEEDAANRRIRELRDDLRQAVAAEGFDLASFEQSVRGRLGGGVLTDVSTQFSTADLPYRHVETFHAVSVDVLLPPDVLALIWSGGPQSMGGAWRTAHVALGKALADLSARILDDHFGTVNLISRYEDAQSPLVLHITGMDFQYRNRPGIRVRWSGTGKLGLSACFEGNFVLEEHLQSEETIPYARGSDFANGDSISVVASDVIRQTLDMAADRVGRLGHARLQEYLISESGAAMQAVSLIEVPDLPVAAGDEPLDQGAALGAFEAALESAAVAVARSREH